MMRRTELNRRAVLAGSAALAAFGPSRVFAQSDELSDADVAEMLRDEGEPLHDNVGKTVRSAFWFQLPPERRLAAVWPEDRFAFDYCHLASSPGTTKPFRLTADSLSRTISAGSFEPASANPKLLFGLRGCRRADGGGWSDFAEMQLICEATPDHLNARCLLGVLDRSSGRIALARGSTVPNIDLMQKQIDGELGCNMLPTGLHRYKVGPHKGLKQPGAFRQQSSLWVHRAKNSPTYSLADRGNVWDDLNGSLPFDDIHAAMLSYRSKPPFFSSAGCQVVEGRYGPGHAPIGPWREFRIAAGLAPVPHVTGGAGATPEDGRSFDYLLLTGRELRIAADQHIGVAETVRYGASGTRVSATLGKLGASGKAVDRPALGKIIAWQAQRSIPPTGILTVPDLKAIGV